MPKKLLAMIPDMVISSRVSRLNWDSARSLRFTCNLAGWTVYSPGVLFAHRVFNAAQSTINPLASAANRATPNKVFVQYALTHLPRKERFVPIPSFRWGSAGASDCTPCDGESQVVSAIAPGPDLRYNPFPEIEYPKERAHWRKVNVLSRESGSSPEHRPDRV